MTRPDSIFSTVRASSISEDHPVRASDPLAPCALRVAEVAKEILMPNLAEMILDIGLRQERNTYQQLNSHVDHANSLQKTLSDCIDVNGGLVLPSNNEKVKLSDDLLVQFKKLEEKGIKILHENEKEVAPERLAEIKVQINSHVDRLKTELQITFTKDIQVKINELSSLLDSLKTIEKYSSRLHETLIKNQRS